MDIIIIIVLILLNGIFAMSEIAVISARKTSLMKDSKEGNKGAATALSLANDPDKFLSTIQIGITLIGILTGIYSGDTVAKELSNILTKIHIPQTYTHIIAQVIVVALVTYLTLIFGELVPKRIGMVMPEKIAKVVSRPMTILSKIGAPFVWILSKSASIVSRVLGIKDDKSPVTEEEIKSMIEEGRQGGEVKDIEQDIIERAFFLGDRKIESIMTHRSDIVFLDINMSNDEIKKIISKHSFSAYPVVDNNLDNIVGVIRVTDVFDKLNNSKSKIEKFVKKANYFHNNMEVYLVLEEMKKNKTKIGLISDEFGNIDGMVTQSDIFSALVGSVSEGKESKDIKKRKNGGWFVDGQCPIYDFLEYFEIEDENASNTYNTISGLILELLQHVPSEGESIEWKNLNIEIVDMDGARIDKVIVNKIDIKEEKEEDSK
ncbi:hemolysin family protein [uncultured Brachyspira sp.]|uniref:hemolysin family protein n=1 Tax=uncultured Brachyspira sp. TaxID=221953 RepID=UPI002627BE2C|nr:hemolysin family protein [uncultured Brachyspira sp.]